jgi:hypothetical protein
MMVVVVAVVIPVNLYLVLTCYFSGFCTQKIVTSKETKLMYSMRHNVIESAS